MATNVCHEVSASSIESPLPEDGSESRFVARPIDHAAQRLTPLVRQLVVATGRALAVDRRGVLPAVDQPFLVEHPVQHRIEDTRADAGALRDVVSPMAP